MHPRSSSSKAPPRAPARSVSPRKSSGRQQPSTSRRRGGSVPRRTKAAPTPAKKRSTSQPPDGQAVRHLSKRNSSMLLVKRVPADYTSLRSATALADDEAKRYAADVLKQLTPSRQTSEGAVRVAVRLRPVLRSEDGVSGVVMHENGVVRISTSDNSFTFDAAFDDTATQEAVFESLGLPTLAHLYSGFNCSIFAYGQTGSGKSHTMMGPELDPGLIPRIGEVLCHMASASLNETEIKASYVEIYNERLRDLLNPSQAGQDLKIRQSATLGTFVDGLTQHVCQSYADIKNLVSDGLHQRVTASTNMNAESSRSHACFTLHLAQIVPAGEETAALVRTSKVTLVDLAGSERADKTGARGTRLREGSNINKSLTTLGRCIVALAKNSSNAAKGASDAARRSMSAGGGGGERVPFRDSKLTLLMKNELAGNARTTLLAAVSGAAAFADETLSTMRFAASASYVRTRAVVNEDSSGEQLASLQAELASLRRQLATPHSDSADTEGVIRGLERELEDQSLTPQQRLQGTRDMEVRRLNALYLDNAHEGTVKMTPHLINLHPDPSLSRTMPVFVPFSETLRIGRADATVPQHLTLNGVGIKSEHAVIVGTALSVMRNGAVAYVNGRAIGEDAVQLQHGDRVVLGSCSFCAQWIHPGAAAPAEDDWDEDEATDCTYDDLIEELFTGKREEKSAAQQQKGPDGESRKSRLFNQRLVRASRLVAQAKSVAQDASCPELTFSLHLNASGEGSGDPSHVFQQIRDTSNTELIVRCMVQLDTSKTELFEVDMEDFEDILDNLLAQFELVKSLVRGSENASSPSVFYSAIFQSADVNGDGSLCAAELRELLESINITSSDAAVRRMMAMYDTDRNGTIDSEEFVGLCRRLMRETVGKALYGHVADHRAFLEWLEHSAGAQVAQAGLSSVAVSAGLAIGAITDGPNASRLAIKRLEVECESTVRAVVASSEMRSRAQRQQFTSAIEACRARAAAALKVMVREEKGSAIGERLAALQRELGSVLDQAADRLDDEYYDDETSPPTANDGPGQGTGGQRTTTPTITAPSSTADVFSDGDDETIEDVLTAVGQDVYDMFSSILGARG